MRSNVVSEIALTFCQFFKSFLYCSSFRPEKAPPESPCDLRRG